MGSNYGDDFFREVYYAQLDHKDKLDSADSVLAGVLLALSGVGMYYSHILPSCDSSICGCVFVVFCILFLIAFSFATGAVIASFWPRNKEYIASPKEWGAFIDGLQAYYGDFHDEEKASKRIAADLAEALRQKYMEAGEVNRSLNIKKMAYQTWAKYSITAAVVLLLVNSIPTYLVQRAKSDSEKIGVITFPEVQKVEIIAPKSKGPSP